MKAHPADVDLVTRLIGQRPVVANEALAHKAARAAEEVLRIQVIETETMALPEFIREAWRIVEPGTELSWNWHLDVLCDVLRSVSRGETKRVIINVPPGTMKSLLVSVFWPCWEWAMNPTLRYLCGAYGAELSNRDNQRVRDIMESGWYKERFPRTRLEEKQRRKTRFATTAKGWRIATSVGGAGTGEHPDRIIVDDPLTAEQAFSKQYLDRAQRWFSRTISTRGESRGAAQIIIMQRLHEDDLAGYLLREFDGWDHVMFPMEYDPDHRLGVDERDERTVNGELLWEERFPRDAVDELKIKLGPFGTASQLQQDPVPEGGGLFKRDWLPIVEEPPSDDRVLVRGWGWDTGGEDEESDYTVGVLMSLTKDGEFYVEDVVRGHYGPFEVDEVMLSAARTTGILTRIREEQEPGSSGKKVIAARSRLLQGYDYEGVAVSGSKITRAKPFRASAQAGNVRLVKGEWNRDYINELCAFPVGENDDQVDGSSCAYNGIALENDKRGGVLWT